jgi:hypothetical protein
MWQQKTVAFLGLAMVVWGCGQAPDTSADQSSAGIHLPSTITQLVQPTHTIDTLSADLVDRTVRVEGRVQQRAPLLTGSLYLIADDTGAIWVRSDQSPPDEGAVITLKGTVQYQQILTDGADISEYYLSEQSRSPLRAPSESP